ISMFDGSSVVNLHALILQFRQITKARLRSAHASQTRRKEKDLEQLSSRLETIFSLHKPLPNFDPTKLELFGRGADDVLQGLEIAIEQLDRIQKEADVDREMLSMLIGLSEMLLEELNTHDELIANSKFEFGHDQSPELFEIAKKYCTLHAAVSCLHMWIYNRKVLGEFFAKGEWLVLSLHRLLRSLRPLPYFISEAYIENVAQELIKLDNENKLFSIVPFQLAQTQEETNANKEFQLQY
ncbi:MAG: acyl-CoA dehydrogenase, partial [Xenococcaceae cyanobacterium]